MNSTDEDSSSSSEIDPESRPRSYLELRKLISSPQKTRVIHYDEASLRLIKDIAILEVADKSHGGIESVESFEQSYSFPGKIFGGFIKFLAKKHKSRKALKAFEKVNLDFNGEKPRIRGVEENYTKRGCLYLQNYANLSALLANEEILVIKEHHKLELDHILKEMRRTDLTYYHANKRLTSHPFILSPYEILDIISEIVEIFDILDEKNICRVEQANVSYLKKCFLRDFSSFKNWRSKIKSENPQTKILDEIPENLTEDILLLLRTLKDSVSNFLIEFVSFVHFLLFTEIRLSALDLLHTFSRTPTFTVQF